MLKMDSHIDAELQIISGFLHVIFYVCLRIFALRLQFREKYLAIGIGQDHFV